MSGLPSRDFLIGLIVLCFMRLCVFFEGSGRPVASVMYWSVPLPPPLCFWFWLLGSDCVGVNFLLICSFEFASLCMLYRVVVFFGGFGVVVLDLVWLMRLCRPLILSFSYLNWRYPHGSFQPLCASMYFSP